MLRLNSAGLLDSGLPSTTLEQYAFRLVELPRKVGRSTVVRVHLLHELAMRGDDVFSRCIGSETEYFPRFLLIHPRRNGPGNRLRGRRKTSAQPPDEGCQYGKENQ